MLGSIFCLVYCVKLGYVWVRITLDGKFYGKIKSTCKFSM